MARKLASIVRIAAVSPIPEADRLEVIEMEGKTARGNEREGLVFKTVDAPYVSFKAVSNRYLLKNG